ncbi:sensor domain-containing protein [Saccharopolyspora indica]|uniref:sensor histidine kinase n=1 Tax=Saccharopolyspora indica TaxID=1229659 RepID=UPI0022EB9F7C|nr:sensor domain-containing protein [Saccharopolyspora indica]MDA3647117.1 sensor domain-containing protein [Saccharopolyspora indica]
MPIPPTALTAVTTRGFLLSGWPWRSAVYLLTGLLPTGAVALPLAACALPWVVLVQRLIAHDYRALGVLVTGAALTALVVITIGPLWAIVVASAERYRLRLVDRRPARSGHRTPDEPGLLAWVRLRFTEAATWRETAYALLLVIVTPMSSAVAATIAVADGILVVSPLLVASGQPVMLGPLGTVTDAAQGVPYAIAGLVLLPGLLYLAGLVAGAHAALARALITGDPGDRLRAELTEVSRSRARLVDAFEAERRRIERDLHDGAQQRLVGLTLQLGLARHDLPADTAAARAVAEAHEQAKQFMAELRELINGIHPPVLTDRGLPGALEELADRFAAIPVTMTVDLPGRLPDPVESTVYFVVSEALTNVAKHAASAGATVLVRGNRDVVTAEIRDDGRGGADAGRGKGLTGLADRVAVLGGTMSMSSPVGGPTVVRVELPCRP